MEERKTEFMNLISNVFNSAMKAQDLYIRNSEFNDLSLTEMHVIEAAAKESFPTMSNVSKKLKITIGTLTTNVKTIIKKGYMTKVPYEKDHRYNILGLTDKGYQALKVHEEFHKELGSILDKYIPEEQFNWVYETFTKVQTGLIDFQKEIEKK